MVLIFRDRERLGMEGVDNFFWILGRVFLGDFKDNRTWILHDMGTSVSLFLLGNCFKLKLLDIRRK